MTAVQLPFTSDPYEGHNPYLVAFASTRGLTVDVLVAGDHWQAAFMAWMSRQWITWCEATSTPHAFRLRHADEFDAWLRTEYPAVPL